MKVEFTSDEIHTMLEAIMLTIKVSRKRTNPAATRAFNSASVASPNFVAINEATLPPSDSRILDEYLAMLTCLRTIGT